MPSYYYKQKVTVTTSQTEIELPPLRSISLINVGGADCQFEFDGSVDANSLDAKQNMPLNWNGQFTTIALKTAASSTEVYLTGLRHIKA